MQKEVKIKSTSMRDDRIYVCVLFTLYIYIICEKKLLFFLVVLELLAALTCSYHSNSTIQKNIYLLIELQNVYK